MTTLVNWYQKNQKSKLTIPDFNEARDDRVVVAPVCSHVSHLGGSPSNLRKNIDISFPHA